MKNVIVFGSILAATAAAFACGDSSGEGGGGGSTTQTTSAPASGSGNTSTKAASTSANASTANSTTAAGQTTATATVAASTGTGMACAPTGDVCQDCIFSMCCDQYTACAADAACQTCMDCLQTDGIACLTNGMCNIGDATQGAFIQCAQGCQAQCT